MGSNTAEMWKTQVNLSLCNQHIHFPQTRATSLLGYLRGPKREKEWYQKPSSSLPSHSSFLILLKN